MEEIAERLGWEEGIFDDITDDEYHYGKYRMMLSNSGFKPLARSQIHFKTWRDREPPGPNSREKDFFTFGKAYHVWMLERQTFFDRFYVVDKMTRRGKAWEDTIILAKDKQILWREDLIRIQEMADAIPLNRTAEAILQNPGVYERTYIWKNQYGIWCKCRTDIDIEDLDVIGDLKSTDDAEWEAFGRKSFNMGYNIQACHYVTGVGQLTGRHKTFVLLAQEKEKPYASSVHRVSEDIIMNAAEKMDPLMQRLARAFREKHWGSYDDKVLELFQPYWYK